MPDIKTCEICGKQFDKKEVGRTKITIKLSKGERTIWICKDHELLKKKE